MAERSSLNSGFIVLIGLGNLWSLLIWERFGGFSSIVALGIVVVDGDGGIGHVVLEHNARQQSSLPQVYLRLLSIVSYSKEISQLGIGVHLEQSL